MSENKMTHRSANIRGAGEGKEGEEMKIAEVIEQLERLIDDREAFIRAYAPDRNVFVRDKEALEEAVKILQLIADNNCPRCGAKMDEGEDDGILQKSL